jgi:hypothetical protein
MDRNWALRGIDPVNTLECDGPCLSVMMDPWASRLRVGVPLLRCQFSSWNQQDGACSIWGQGWERFHNQIDDEADDDTYCSRPWRVAEE